MKPSHFAPTEQVGEWPLNLFRPLADQGLSAIALHSSSVGVNNFLLIFFTFPVSASTIRLGDVASDSHLIYRCKYPLSVTTSSMLS